MGKKNDKQQQGNPKDGEIKATARRVSEADARDRRIAERKQRDAIRAQQAESARVANVVAALTMFDNSSKNFDAMYDGVPGIYGIQLNKKLADVSLFGEVVVEIVKNDLGTAVWVRKSNFPPINASDTFFFPFPLMRGCEVKNIGQGIACYEWQLELQAAFQFHKQNNKQYLTQYVRSLTAPQFGARPAIAKPVVPAVRRIDGFDRSKSLSLSRQVLTSRIKQDSLSYLCHIGGHNEMKIYFVRERVAGAQKITFLEGGDNELLTAIEDHHPEGVSVDVQSVVDGPQSVVTSVDLKDVRNARLHIISWLHPHFDFPKVDETAQMTASA